MQPVIVLVASYLTLTLMAHFSAKPRPRTWRGRVAMAVMLLFTGAAHFFMTDAMVEMVPRGLPSPIALVYLTGVLEIAGALALLTRYHRAASWALIALLVALFPANVWSAVQHTGMGGHRMGPIYLWLRAPMQLGFIVWLWWSSRDQLQAVQAAGVP